MEKWPLKSGKTCLLSDSYTPGAPIADLQGRDRELKMVYASWIARGGQPPLCPIMVGEPGVGKNRIVYELARITGMDLYIMQGHEDITAEDLACSVRFADDSRRIDYVLSPLVAAMLRGQICFLDEIGKIRPRALALLVSVLDERRYIDSTLLGERIVAAPSFRFVAATNTGEISGLPEFIRSRMRPVIGVDYPSVEDINGIIGKHRAVDEANQSEIKSMFWTLWTRSHPPTPRDIIQLLALATTLNEYDLRGKVPLRSRSPKDAKDALNDMPASPIGPEHIKKAFEELFQQGTP